MIMTKTSRGYTLIELMVTVGIAGMLAMVAIPTYTDSTRTARRADAYDSLLYLQGLQEKYRANNSTYGTLAQTSFPGTTSNDGLYDITITGPTATGFVATATAADGGPQTEDAGCTTLTVTVSAANPRGVRAPAACW